MSLPPALLQRLAQRGLVNKQKVLNQQSSIETSSVTSAQIHSTAVENEEVIAEDYDEMDEENDKHQHQQQPLLTVSEEYQYPSQYDLDQDLEGAHKRIEDNYWLTQMKVRMAEAGSTTGFKGCPNKYNIWHKCTLYCVNRWGEGIIKPNAEYMKRYKRLIRKYPLPDGWTELYDPGCGCYYFACEADNVVSWLPPTHPQSIITKCAAAVRRQMDESATRDENVMTNEDDDGDDTNGVFGDDSDDDGKSGMGNHGEDNESPQARHHREVEEIINASIRKAKSSVTTGRNNKTIDNNNSNNSNNSTNTINIKEFPSLEEAAYCPTVSLPRKQKSRDLDKALSKQNRRTERFKEERDRNHHFQLRNHETELLDPMDPSAYSHIPPGKWSDGLHNDSNNSKKNTEEIKQQLQCDKSDNDNSDYQSD